MIIDLLKDILNGSIKVFQKEVKKYTTSGAIFVHKKHIGKKVIILIEDD